MYFSEIALKRPNTPCKLEWFLLIAVFLLSGVIGHDPWKQDETYSFGMIYHFYTTHTWLVPMNVGQQPFMEKPPLYYWSATLMCRLFDGVLPLHDAARLTSVLYMLVTIVFMWRLSQLLFEKHTNRKAMGGMAIALLLGTSGLVRHAHDMFTDVALLSGDTIAMYGMALIINRQTQWKRAGLWLGLGIGIAFMSKGFFTPIVLSIAATALWMLLPHARTRSTVLALATAFLVAAPFLFIWPMLLYQHSPPLFMQWFWDNNVGRFLGFSVSRLGAPNTPNYFLHAPLWFAFPVLPLAMLLLLNPTGWRRPERLLPLTISIAGMVLLLASASARALYLLPLLPAFTILAVQELTDISPKLLLGWNMLTRLFISIAGLLILLSWWCLLNPTGSFSHQVLHVLQRWLPIDFMPSEHYPFAYMLAVLAIVLWLCSMRFNPRLPLSTARIWLTGMTLLWGLSHTLLLPWLNETKSYLPRLAQMNAYIEHSAYAKDCVGNDSLGESIGPMLEYSRRAFAPMEDFNYFACRLTLRSVKRGSIDNPDPRWRLVWRDARPLDSKEEELRLYAHIE